MYSLPKNVYRERKDFSKIKTTVPIPNLIEIQRKSYERFLQMNRLPSEREDAGLQSVFKSVFPISDFRENSSLEFIEYSIGNWECKCGKLAGLHHLRKPCKNCGTTLIADPLGEHTVLCTKCGVRRLHVLTNMVSGTAEGEQVFRRLAGLAARFLAVSLDHIGSIPRDPAVQRAVMRGEPVIQAYPDSPAAHAFSKIAEALQSSDHRDERSGALRLFWRRLLRQQGGAR